MTRTERFFAAAGVAVLLFYLASTTQLIQSANPLTLGLMFAIGPVGIMGMRRFSDSLVGESNDEALRLGKTLLIIAFTLFTTMVVMQEMISLQFGDLIAAAEGTDRAATLRVVHRGVNLVQLGLDVAFDVFYCLGLGALAASLFRRPAFGRVVGMVGMLSAVGLLALNLIAFPYIPKDVGLVDLGPVTGVWWLTVIVLQVRRRRAAPPVHALS